MEAARGVCEPLACLAGFGGIAVSAPAVIFFTAGVGDSVQAVGQCPGFDSDTAAQDSVPGQPAPPGTGRRQCYDGGCRTCAQWHTVAGESHLEAKVSHQAGLCASGGHETCPAQGGWFYHPPQSVFWIAACMSGPGVDASVYFAGLGI